VWFEQLKWEGPFCVHSLVAGAPWPGIETNGSGVYVFTGDPGSLLKSRVLYIGKSDGAKQTLKRRVSAYIRRMRRPFPPLRPHAGMESLCDYYRAQPHALFVRWAGCVVSRDIEGRLIEFYEPEFNGRDEAIVYCDDEPIPLEFL
jgi:hypothetical protein